MVRCDLIQWIPTSQRPQEGRGWRLLNDPTTHESSVNAGPCPPTPFGPWVTPFAILRTPPFSAPRRSSVTLAHGYHYLFGVMPSLWGGVRDCHHWRHWTPCTHQHYPTRSFPKDVSRQTLPELSRP